VFLIKKMCSNFAWTDENIYYLPYTPVFKRAWGNDTAPAPHISPIIKIAAVKTLKPLVLHFSGASSGGSIYLLPFTSCSS